jgi:hypothetical protein
MDSLTIDVLQFAADSSGLVGLQIIQTIGIYLLLGVSLVVVGLLTLKR